MIRRPVAWLWSVLGRFLARTKPSPALGLLSVAVPGAALFVWLKLAAVAGVAAFGAYHVGHYMGDLDGYNRHRVEMAAERDRKNREIDVLNAKLEEARERLESARDNASVNIINATSGAVTKEVREKCSKECSLPEDIRAGLEGIE